MASVRTRNTEPELILKKCFFAVGLRYRLHKKGLPGRPDIVFPQAKVAVFCDGDFWHGRNWKKRKASDQFKVRTAYWIDKIETNVARDRRNNRDSREMGWLVLRYWSTDIKKQAPDTARKVKRLIKNWTRLTR